MPLIILSALRLFVLSHWLLFVSNTGISFCVRQQRQKCLQWIATRSLHREGYPGELSISNNSISYWWANVFSLVSAAIVH